MRNIIILLKKELIETLAFTKNGKKNFDVIGFIISLLISILFITVFILIFSRFIELFYNVKKYGVPDIALRNWQILSVAYLLILIIGTLTFINNINHEIFERDDLNILISLPVTATEVFWAKLIIVYLKQIIVMLITIIPVNFSFIFVQKLPVSYYFLTLFACLIFPLITAIVGSIFVIPFRKIKQLLDKKYTISFIVMLLVTLFGLYGYIMVINNIKFLLINGDIKYIFNESFMGFVEKVTSYAYPTNFLVNILTNKDVGLNLLYLILLLTISSVIVFIFLHKLLENFIKTPKVIKQRNSKKLEITKRHSTLMALLKKEMMIIYQTPIYSFQFFVITLIMPAFVYLCSIMLESFLVGLLFIELTAPICLALVTIFSSLTNTFCATNISRDGDLFLTSKSFPISIKEIVISKVLLCFITNFISIIIALVALAWFNFISIPESLIMLVISSLLAFSQICFATKIDFNNPIFTSEENGVIRSSNSTVSKVLLISLSVSFIFAIICISNEVLGSLLLETLSGFWLYSIIFLISFLVAVVSFVYLFRKLDEQYQNFIGGKII